MKTLVTGATGFLGASLARQLRERGDDVRVLVRDSSDRRRLAGLDLDYAIGDITDLASVQAALTGIDRIFHAAALYELGTKDPSLMERINVGGTKNVLQAARDRDIPTVYVSSVIALGPTGERAEDESFAGREIASSHYEATKRTAHAFATSMAEEGARLRVAMPVTIYGPGDQSLIGSMFEYYLRRLMPLGAFASTRISMVYVDDCARGLIDIADRGRDGEQYILSAQVVSFRELFEELGAVSGIKPPRTYLSSGLVKRGAPFAKLVAPLIGLNRSLVDEGVAFGSEGHWCYSGDKAADELGWRYRPLREGLRAIVEARRSTADQ